MNLIIGGAYQGKTDWAKARFGLDDGAVFVCENGRDVDFSKPCITHLERFALDCLRQGKEPKDELFAHRAQWENAVLICDDTNCGVVPMEAETRAWREACGRMLNALSPEAEHVWRIFCGLALELK